MKNTKTIFGIVAALAIIGFSMTACDNGNTDVTPPAPQVTVTFDLDDGNANAAFAAKTVAKGAVVAEPTEIPTKGTAGDAATEKFFKGWVTGTTPAPYDFSKKVDADIMLKATWSADNTTKVFRVKFDNNTVLSQFVNDGSTATALSTPPTKTDLTLQWWTDAITPVQHIIGTTQVTEHINLKARWMATVTFDSDGGSTVSNATVEEGEQVTKPTDPTKADYTFGDWRLFADSTLADAAYTFSTPVTGNITLKATWIADLDVKFYFAGTISALTSPHSVKVAHNTLIGAKKPADPTSGTTFKHWAEVLTFNDDAPATWAETAFAFDTVNITKNTNLVAVFE